jgi:hypothetical protein
MLRTKHLIGNISEVPIEWVFETYLTLGEKLSGQDVRIKSAFNPKDKDPSLFIYHSKTSNRYKWKDFSVGKGGDGVELVQELFNMGKRFDAALKIVNDYNDFLLKGGSHSVADFKIRSKYQIKSIKPRNWNTLDVKYWGKYKIGSKLLEHFNVQPLESFTLEKEDSDQLLVIKGTKIYGYHRKDGSLFKIYQPMMKLHKFFKVKDYIQGVDQLTFKKDYLVICSSLKDLLTFTKMGFKNAEGIAPDSENVLIPERIILKAKEKYKGVCTLFDNDDAGIRSMMKYKDKYGIPGAHLKLEKDLAECVEVHGINNTRENLYPVLTKALTGSIKQLP